MEEDIAATTVSVKNVKVMLSTQTQYKIPPQPYMIPVSFRRFHLSQLINQVLALPNAVPFDFLFNGDMLRTSVGEMCDEKALSAVRVNVFLWPASVLNMAPGGNYSN